MATTFLEYLTQPNPDLDTSRCKEGPSHKSRIGYGPHYTKEWKDVTWHNLSVTFQDVLMERMEKPKIANAQDVPAVKTRIFKEPGITTLAEHWNEPVIEHALDGTQEKLRVKDPEGPLGRGKLHFVKNDGRGDVEDEKGTKHSPDWFVFQEQADGDYKLVFGDTKPAKKFRSQYLKRGTKKRLQKEAYYPLEQITKYMWLGKTRYGFLLTEEELVLVRLSLSKRNTTDAEPDPEEDYRVLMLTESMGSGLSKREDSGATVDFRGAAHSRSFDSYAGSQSAVHTVLEWSRIPWSSSGSDKLTVNLGLWWWTVLAIQSCSIKEDSKYTALGDRRRGHSPEFEIEGLAVRQPRVPRGESERTPGKRRAGEPQASKQASRRSKRQRRTLNYNESDSPPSTRRRSAANNATYTNDSPDGVAVTTFTAPREISVGSPRTPFFSSPSLRQSERPGRRTASRTSSQVTAMSSQTTEQLYTSFQSVGSQA